MLDSGPGATGHAVWSAGGGAVLRARRPGATSLDFWLRCCFARTAGCYGACSLECWWRCCFASSTAGCYQFGLLVEVLFCEDGRVLGGMQFGVLVDMVEVLLCEIDDRVLRGM